MVISSYFKEHEQDYIKGFADYIAEDTQELTQEEAIKLFKDYMLFYKNIIVDMRNRFWKQVFLNGMKLGGYFYNGKMVW